MDFVTLILWKWCGMRAKVRPGPPGGHGGPLCWGTFIGEQRGCDDLARRESFLGERGALSGGRTRPVIRPP